MFTLILFCLVETATEIDTVDETLTKINIDIAADKTTNYYKVSHDTHSELLLKNITKDYKKADKKKSDRRDSYEWEDNPRANWVLSATESSEDEDECSMRPKSLPVKREIKIVKC